MVIGFSQAELGLPFGGRLGARFRGGCGRRFARGPAAWSGRCCLARWRTYCGPSTRKQTQALRNKFAAPRLSRPGRPAGTWSAAFVAARAERGRRFMAAAAKLPHIIASAEGLRRPVRLVNRLHSRVDCALAPRQWRKISGALKVFRLCDSLPPRRSEAGPFWPRREWTVGPPQLWALCRRRGVDVAAEIAPHRCLVLIFTSCDILASQACLCRFAPPPVA